MITNINVNKIFPHPDNPRKDLGDLTELAASIKANGILQNLTVVPQKSGYCVSCNLYNSGIGKCEKDYDKKERPPCPKWESNGKFTAVIGHRRHAGAKLAGLTEVPCVISDMDHKTQVETMLLENMQRSDLTVYEQAQGFQMLMDFGESIDAISEQTGFSESTIRRRVKLLDLDKEKFQQSVSRGATLQDYAELDKIRDIKTRNKILEKIGTSNFQWELKNAIDKETSEANKAALIAELEKFATQVKETSGLRSVRWFSGFSADLKNLRPADASEKEYFFTVSPYNIHLLEKETAKADTKAEKAMQEERRQMQERRERLNEINKQAFQLRQDFVRNYNGSKKHARAIMEFTVKSSLSSWDYSCDSDDLREILGIEAPADKDDSDEELTFAHISEAFEQSPERVLLATAYCAIASQHQQYHDWQCKFKGDTELDIIYDCLRAIGYEISDEERSLRDGTHELYVKNDLEG